MDRNRTKVKLLGLLRPEVQDFRINLFNELEMERLKKRMNKIYEDMKTKYRLEKHHYKLDQDSTRSSQANIVLPEIKKRRTGEETGSKKGTERADDSYIDDSSKVRIEREQGSKDEAMRKKEADKAQVMATYESQNKAYREYFVLFYIKK